MANSEINQLTELIVTPASGDWLIIDDVSEIVGAPTPPATKKITVDTLLSFTDALSQTFTNKIINSANNTITITASRVSDFDTEVSNNSNVAANSAKVTYPSADSTKLAGIETGATTDQTNSEIKIAYESNADTNEFSDVEQTKLATIESSSTADQTGAEIKTLYEVEVSAFTDTQFTKLAGIETAATADQTNAEIKTAVEAATDSNTFTDADHSKLNAIEASATADQTASEIKTLYESNNDTNEFSDTEQTKLLNIETSATADQTGAEIKTLYQAEANAFTDTKNTKLTGIETLADVTDSTNVNSAGAVMESDTDVSGVSFVLDEDTMSSDSNTKVPTQQSVKAYVDSTLTSDITLKGDYNASTNSPDLDTSPSGVQIGDHYVISVAGTFFSESLQAGDSIISKQDNPTTLAHWILTNNNLTTPISDNEVSATAAIQLSKLATDPLARTNHTGTQLSSTISDFDTEVTNNSAVTANTSKVTNATHTGDVTGSTSLTIASGAVDDSMLAGSITPSKVTGTAAILGANTFTGTQSHGDNVISLYGTGSDLKIHHNGANNLIEGVAGNMLFYTPVSTFHRFLVNNVAIADIDVNGINMHSKAINSVGSSNTLALLGNANNFTAKQTMPLLDVLQSGLNASVGIEIGNDNASSTTAIALIDLRVNGGDYDTRIIRQAGDNGNLQIENLGTGKIHLSNQDVQMDTGKKLYLDGGSDSYITEFAGDVITIATNNSNRFFANNDGCGVSGGFQKFFLDGGGDTYITESDFNIVDIFVGGTARGNFTSDVATFYNVRPPTNVVYDLGTASLKYRKLFVDNVEGIQNLVHDLTSTASVSGARTLDFNTDQLESWALSGSTAITFNASSNKAVGRSKTIRLVNDGTLQNLTLNSSWKIVGTAPTDIAASKTGILTLTCFGTAETDIVAAYAVEA